MNDKLGMRRSRLTYIAIGCLMSLSACNQAEMPVVGHVGDSRAIAFRATLADAPESRSAVTTLATFNDFYVTSYFGGHDFAGDDSEDLVYFKDTHFSMNAAESRYKSDIRYVWPATALEFFAYSPALATMKATKDEDEPDNLFEFANNTAASGNVSAGYRMTGFRVHPDISRHFDFLTAHAKITYESKKDSTANLEFNHNLCQIELNACFKDPATNYKLEAAGVVIGNPQLEGTFNFCGDSHGAGTSSTKGKWEMPARTGETKVEYIYSEGEQFLSVPVGNPVSLMGRGGNAMVLPSVNAAWDTSEDPSNSRNGAYIAVLLRATAPNGTCMYPAPGLSSDESISLVYFAVDASEKIISRVYIGDNAGEYYCDEEKTKAFELPAGARIVDFAWAAVPVEMNWAEGKKYVYNLNYSSGIGVRDPHEPISPGHPILSNGLKATVTLTDWAPASAMDIRVPGAGGENNNNNGDKK